jgi:light-harvesting protein B-800-850 alpha chain
MGAAGSVQGNTGSIPLENFQELTKAYEAKKGEGEVDDQAMFEHLKGIYEGLAPAAATPAAEGDASTPAGDEASAPAAEEAAAPAAEEAAAPAAEEAAAPAEEAAAATEEAAPAEGAAEGEPSA